MIFIAGIMTLSIVGLIALGLYLELSPEKRIASPRRARKWLFGNFGLFVLALVGLLAFGAQEVMAETAATVARGEISIGLGLAIIGIGLPTGLAAIGAALALGPVGSAALAVVAEKPEMFGRTLIYLGLAEGIAIYGLVMSILLLGKI
jgi:V/A-type H+/Na+-transporting ATPase subunit K